MSRTVLASLLTSLNLCREGGTAGDVRNAIEFARKAFSDQ